MEYFKLFLSSLSLLCIAVPNVKPELVAFDWRRPNDVRRFCIAYKKDIRLQEIQAIISIHSNLEEKYCCQHLAFDMSDGRMQTRIGGVNSCLEPIGDNENGVNLYLSAGRCISKYDYKDFTLLSRDNPKLCVGSVDENLQLINCDDKDPDDDWLLMKVRCDVRNENYVDDGGPVRNDASYRRDITSIQLKTTRSLMDNRATVNSVTSLNLSQENKTNPSQIVNLSSEMEIKGVISVSDNVMLSDYKIEPSQSKAFRTNDTLSLILSTRNMESIMFSSKPQIPTTSINSQLQYLTSPPETKQFHLQTSMKKATDKKENLTTLTVSTFHCRESKILVNTDKTPLTSTLNGKMDNNDLLPASFSISLAANRNSAIENKPEHTSILTPVAGKQYNASSISNFKSPVSEVSSVKKT